MNEKLEREIRRLEEKIIEAHRNDTELFRRLDRAQRELGILESGRPFCPFLRPQFFTRQKYDEIVRAAETLSAAFERMTLAALEEPEIMAELALTEREERLARIDPGYRGICNSSRLDTFFSGDDFRFLEYNGETPAGIIDQMQIEKVLALIPEVTEFLAENEHWRPAPQKRLLEALLADYRESGGEREKPNIAIVDWKDVATVSEFEVLRRFFETEGHSCRIIDPHNLEYDGINLSAGDFRIDIFYKRVLIHEYLDQFDDHSPLIRAYTDGNILMANSFRTKIPHKKASFAVAGDPRFASLFTPLQREMIERHIPWTRRVRDGKTVFKGKEIDLLEHLRREKDRFTLKPNDDYGGSGIRLGWETSQGDWETALSKALEEPFVVQERVPVEKVSFPAYGETVERRELLIDFDPFLFRGRVEGGLVRLSASSLVNVAQGGGETALIVLE
ncbi:MAG: hypothetical protein R2747_08120 [Pyrinomonadaceae bacterium]